MPKQNNNSFGRSRCVPGLPRLSWSHTMSKNIASSEFYEPISDVKVEFVNSDDERETNFGVSPEEQKQHGRNSNSALEHEGSSRDTFQIGTPCIGDEMDIKYEVNDIEHHHMIYAEDDLDNEDQPTRDPLHINPLDLDQSSAIEIKCEVYEDIQGMDCSEESDSNSESDANSNVESGRGGDPACNHNHAICDMQYVMQRNASHDLNRNPKSGRKFGKDHKRDLTRTRTHTGKKHFKCEVCDKTFSRKDNLIIHTKIHTGNTERPFKCEECAKDFERRNHLTIHMRSHTGEKPYECKECAKTFATNTHLTVHMRVHSGEKPFKCTECVKSFKTSRSLTVHVSIHAQEKPYKCSQCAKSFSTRYYLTVHSRHHTGENQYKCERCDKPFSRKSDLTVHMMNHTGERPYKCGQCVKSYITKGDLTVHIRCHSGERPFKCEECKKGFTTSSKLGMHKKTHK